MNSELILPTLICHRCRHEWIPRKSTRPVRCPKCKSLYWDKSKRVFGRRGFLKLAATTVFVVTTGTLSTVLGHTITGILNQEQYREKTLQLKADRVRLLKQLFGPNQVTALVGGTTHLEPNLRESVDSVPCHSDDYAALMAMKGLFPNSPDYVVDPNLGLPGASESVRCFGSPVSNLVSYEYMTKSTKDGYNLRLGDKTVVLKYNYDLNPPGEYTKRFLDGAEISEKNYGIVMQDGMTLRSRLDSNNVPIDNYLLITKLPSRYHTNRDVIIFGGNQGPGTEALRLLLEDERSISNLDLENILDEIGDKPYYQILFYVDEITFDDSAERHMPGHIRKIGRAYPLSVI